MRVSWSYTVSRSDREPDGLSARILLRIVRGIEKETAWRSHWGIGAPWLWSLRVDVYVWSMYMVELGAAKILDDNY